MKTKLFELLSFHLSRTAWICETNCIIQGELETERAWRAFTEDSRSVERWYKASNYRRTATFDNDFWYLISPGLNRADGSPTAVSGSRWRRESCEEKACREISRYVLPSWCDSTLNSISMYVLGWMNHCERHRSLSDRLYRWLSMIGACHGHNDRRAKIGNSLN